MMIYNQNDGLARERNSLYCLISLSMSILQFLPFKPLKPVKINSLEAYVAWWYVCLVLSGLAADVRKQRGMHNLKGH